MRRLAAGMLLALLATLVPAAPSSALVLDPRPESPNYCFAQGGQCWRLALCRAHKAWFHHHSAIRCRVPRHGLR